MIRPVLILLTMLAFLPFTARAQVTAIVHNAQGWQASHSYTFASAPPLRVLNGAGWTPGSPGHFNPDSALNAYQLISTGSCTSASSGGPTGTGSNIADGSCTWAYVSGVDCVTLSGCLNGDVEWTAKTYQCHQYVTNDSPLTAYMLTGSVGNTDCGNNTIPNVHHCASTVAPTGAGGTLGDGCTWTAVIAVLYHSSGAVHIPHMYLDDSGNVQYAISQAYTFNLYNDAEYLAGANNEFSTFGFAAHQDRIFSATGNSCTFFTEYNSPPSYTVTVQAAAGESFRDHAGTPLVYDATKGVALHNTASSGCEDTVTVADAVVSLSGIQIKSDHGIGVQTDPEHGNNGNVQYSIVDAGGDQALGFDGGWNIMDTLVIARGEVGIRTSYEMTASQVTIVQPSNLSGSVGFMDNDYINGPVLALKGVAIFGFTHATAWCIRDGYAAGANNATDVSSGDSGSAPLSTDICSSGTATALPLPSALYSQNFAASFVSTTADFRLSSGSPLRGASAAITPYSGYDPTALDIMGTTRPQGGAYDISAFQYIGALTPHGPGRFPLR